MIVGEFEWKKVAPRETHCGAGGPGRVSSARLPELVGIEIGQSSERKREERKEKSLSALKEST